MTITRQREEFKRALTNLKNRKNKDEAMGGELMGYERLIEVMDIAETMTEEERAELKSVPCYSTDWRSVKHIKERYGFSWNELRLVASLD